MSNKPLNITAPLSPKEETDDVFEMMGIFGGASVTELLQEVHVEISNPLQEFHNRQDKDNEKNSI